ncbi:MAG: epoxyqueuosine reductase QueH [Clostridiales Family XIII bacterium]|nr:epoxyqueuosine reductase QueH [Clostridiales Family XIII bacterium]
MSGFFKDDSGVCGAECGESYGAASHEGIFADKGDLRIRQKSLLLHSCCGPCSTSVVERLARDYDITVFFYNPNIMDEGEYRRRLETQRSFLEIYNSSPDAPSRVALAVGEYEPSVFVRACEGHESDPEGGERCEICFSLRLAKTAERAALYGFDCFATTLSVSPHKDYAAIARIGGRLGMQCGVEFLAEDFKKHNGFARSVELSKAYGLYRQGYCGCDFGRAGGQHGGGRDSE